MYLIKILKKFGIASIGIFLTLICSVPFSSSKFQMLVLVSGAFLAMLCCGVVFIYLPAKKLDSKLNMLMENGGWKKCLNGGETQQDSDIYEVNRIVQECVKDINRENSLKMMDRQAQINALQSQINPHFLYNTLESIRGQALIEGVDEIAKMVEALSAFFRYSISQKENLVTLRDEMNNIQNYFSIQEYRFNNKFKLEIRLDKEDNYIYDYYLPKLTIQPIVENAIFHGLEMTGDDGHVIIDITQTKKRLLITISDNGLGMDADTVEELNKKIRGEVSFDEHLKPRSTGIALINVNKRIQLIFGEGYGIKVYSTLNRGTDVEITLPIMKDKIKFTE